MLNNQNKLLVLFKGGISYLSLFSLLFILQNNAISEDSPSIYARLKDIGKQYKRIGRHLPTHYTVPVSLSGTIADEIIVLLDTTEANNITFAEMHEGRGKFKLFITNSNMTAYKQELLSGILNPIEMIDIIINSILRFTDPEYLIRIEKETNAKEQIITINSKKFVNIDITPVGKKFGYVYKDFGAYITEGWLTRLNIKIDPETNFIHELHIERCSRTITATHQMQPKTKKERLKYSFNYSLYGDVILPSQLKLYTNDVKTMIVSAIYQQIGSKKVFKSRAIEFYPQGSTTPQNLIMTYGDYRMKNTLKVRSTKDKTEYGKKLKKASDASRKALKTLNNGDIQRAIGILKTIVTRYEGTPQAVEAIRILSGLAPNFD